MAIVLRDRLGLETTVGSTVRVLNDLTPDTMFGSDDHNIIISRGQTMIVEHAISNDFAVLRNDATFVFAHSHEFDRLGVAVTGDDFESEYTKKKLLEGEGLRVKFKQDFYTVHAGIAIEIRNGTPGMVRSYPNYTSMAGVRLFVYLLVDGDEPIAFLVPMSVLVWD